MVFNVFENEVPTRSIIANDIPPVVVSCFGGAALTITRCHLPNPVDSSISTAGIPTNVAVESAAKTVLPFIVVSLDVLAPVITLELVSDDVSAGLL